MKVAFIILMALICVGLALFLHDRKTTSRSSQTPRRDGDPLAADSPSSQESQPSQSSPSSQPSPVVEQASQPAISPSSQEDSEVCCGMHLTCEKDSLLADVSDRIEYFDDEELDRFAGRPADSYTPAEIEEFREILLTLIPSDISPWARSIQLRGIILPPEIRDELLFLVSENRK